MKLVSILICLISLNCLYLQADPLSLLLEEEDRTIENIYLDFALYPYNEDNGSLERGFTSIPLYKRHNAMFIINHFNFPGQSKSIRDRYQSLYRKSSHWVKTTPFSEENKETIQSIIRLYDEAILFGFYEIYDTPIGVPLIREGKTIIFHSKSKKSDPYIQKSWSSDFGRKVWLIEGEMEPGYREVQGEKVYIVSTKDTTSKPGESQKETIFVYKNLFGMIDGLIDRGRCSDFQERVEYTFLSRSFFTLDRYKKSVIDFSNNCILGTSPSDCSGTNFSKTTEFASKLYIPTLSQCQLEYEYIGGKIWAFLHRNYDGVFINDSLSHILSTDVGATEITTGALGMEVYLSYFQEEQGVQLHSPNRSKRMWEGIRQIGIWAKIKREAIKRLNSDADE